jgi:hypothetical protein
LSRHDLAGIDLVSVFVQYVLDDRAMVVELQVEAQEVNVSREQRLRVVLVVDPVLADLVNFAKMLLRRLHVVVLVCVSHLSLLRELDVGGVENLRDVVKIGCNATSRGVRSSRVRAPRTTTALRTARPTSPTRAQCQRKSSGSHGSKIDRGRACH